MAVKHCNHHKKYVAGCPFCQEKSRIYQYDRKDHRLRKKGSRTVSGQDLLWARMTEIGLRWEANKLT